MGFKLNKDEKKRMTELIDKMYDAKSNLEDGIQEFNEKLEEAWQMLQEHIEGYNDVVSEIHNYMDDVHSRLYDEFDSKSDKWRESEKGSAVESMMGEWENQYEFEEMEIERPEDLDPDYEDLGEKLGNLPEEPYE